MARQRGFRETPWRPQNRTLPKLAGVLAVIEEFAAQLPLTIRQVFYRLVAQEIIGKTENSYNSLIDLIGNMRRDKRINMDVIRDDGATDVTRLEIGDWSMEHRLIDIKRQIEEFRLDRQRHQDERLVIWCEAAGMVPQLEAVANDYGVTVQTSGGFDSITTKHNFGNSVGRGYRDYPLVWYPQPTHVLHIGDYDPSGECMFDALQEDVEAFALHYRKEVRFTRLAVTEEQIHLYNLPTAIPKASSHQKKKQMLHTVQCEALDPATLAMTVRNAIENNLDLVQVESVKLEEIERRKEMLQDFPEAWNVEE